jgi:hypothetical protein
MIRLRSRGKLGRVQQTPQQVFVSHLAVVDRSNVLQGNIDLAIAGLT